MSRSFLFAASMAAGLLASAAAFAQQATVSVDNAWSRAQIAGRNGAVFLTITGKGAGDRLLSASSPVATKVELHETTMDKDVMKMREVTMMPIEAGKTVTLAPGGLHIMLMNLKEPLKEGESVPLTLVFEKAGAVTTQALVAKAGAPTPMSGHGHGHGHK